MPQGFNIGPAQLYLMRNRDIGLYVMLVSFLFLLLVSSIPWYASLIGLAAGGLIYKSDRSK